MAVADQHRTPVPRVLHVCSVAFLLTVGLICALVVLSAPAQYIRDPSLMPDHLGAWLWLAGTGLFPVLHWIGVYRRSIVASLLVVPFHGTLLHILVLGVWTEMTEGGTVGNHLFFALFAGFEAFLIGAMLWWAWRLWMVRTGRAAPPTIVQPKRRSAEPVYVPIGKRGWVLERSDFAVEMRRDTETIRRRAPWFLPIWSMVRWPLHIMAWGGLVCASMVVPGFTVMFAAMIADGPEGVLFWSLIGLILMAHAVLFVLSIWMFVSKLRKSIVDVDTLIATPLFALGAATVVLVAMMLQHPEWGWDAQRAEVEAAGSTTGSQRSNS